MSRSLTLLLLVFVACTPSKPDLEKAETEIRSLLQQERKAHFEKNVDLFMSEFAPGMISVNKGVVRRSTEEENRDRIRHYFDSVEFIRWDDVSDPVISFSDDGKLAYAIVQKQVILFAKEDPGRLPDTTNYAWVSIYRKHDNGWKVECNISTNK